MKQKDETMMCIQPYVYLLANQYEAMTNPKFGVSHYYQFEVKEDHQQYANAVPDGSIDILFNIGKNEVKTYLSGTVFGVKKWEMGEERTCFGVRFQPGMGVLPKSMNMDMIVNRDLEIDGNLLGEDLPEKIALAKTMKARTKLFEDAYEKLVMTKDKDVRENIADYIRKRICNEKGNITVETIAMETGYSPCYVRRIFKQYHGISPKQFAQYVRFQNTLQSLDGQQQQYEMLALNCGYYDEPHMIKEFKKYAGFTPEYYSKNIASKAVDKCSFCPA